MPRKSDGSAKTGLKKSRKSIAGGLPVKRQSQPWSIQAQRSMMLEAAGVTPETMGRMVSQALQTLTEQLGATTVKHFAHQGIVTDEREMPAGDVRIKAAKEVITAAEVLMNLKGETAQETKVPNGGQSGVVFHVHTTWGGPLPEGLEPPPVQVTSKDEALDAEYTPVQVPWASSPRAEEAHDNQ